MGGKVPKIFKHAVRGGTSHPGSIHNEQTRKSADLHYAAYSLNV